MSTACILPSRSNLQGGLKPDYLVKLWAPVHWYSVFDLLCSTVRHHEVKESLPRTQRAIEQLLYLEVVNNVSQKLVRGMDGLIELLLSAKECC